MRPLLEVQGFSAGYGRLQVLRDVHFTVGTAETVVLLGSNGAGKTTTLRALSGLVSAQGTAHFDGHDLLRLPAAARVRLGIAHVPQGRGTFVDQTVEQNLRLGGYTRRDRSALRTEMDEMYTLFPSLASRRRQKAGRLSGGKQQMLAIARALMLKPRLLLLDEPSLGLAPKVIENMFAALVRVRDELAVATLLVEQNVHAALGFASRAYVLEAGQLVASGTADELRQSTSVRDAFLGSSACPCSCSASSPV